MTTLEQVEKLRTLANVSYDEAKSALDASNGDILQAIINLEKQGKVDIPAGGGYYSSEKSADSSSEASYTKCSEKRHRHHHHHRYHDRHHNHGECFKSHMKKFGGCCLNMINKGNTNRFDVLKDGESKASVPVTILALLLIFAFWVTIPLMIIGLFFGLRYSFNGPDLSENVVNQAMNSAANAAEDLKKSMN